VGVGGRAGATQGHIVLGHVHTLVNRTRRSVADGCTRVPEVFAAAVGSLKASALAKDPLYGR
jgi:hypothetical protein